MPHLVASSASLGRGTSTMQKIIIEKPYRFIPPHRGNWWPNFIQRFRLIDRYLQRNQGIESYEVRHADRLRASLDVRSRHFANTESLSSR